MTHDKTALIEQMEKQRFLPITGETHDLYETFGSLIDRHDPDALSYLLFFEGEYLFRTGDFNPAIHHLSRCIHAPKSTPLKYLDARSYNIIGHIYGFFGRESIALNCLQQAKSISDTFHFSRESAICRVSLGHIYAQLELYDTALDYFDQAGVYTPEGSDPSYNLAIPCEACRGIILCKTNRYEEALICASRIDALIEEGNSLFYSAAVFDFQIRLFDHQKDEARFRAALDNLLAASSGSLDFLELSRFYFGAYTYLLTQQRQDECRMVLEHIGMCVADSPLVFLHYLYLKCRVRYAKVFLSEDEHLQAGSDFIALRPRFLAEQTYAKLHSLGYVERLRQMKNDSDMYRKKSRTDQMTGLLNKHTIRFLIEEDMAKLSSTKQSAMILVDLDHFKQINDTLGHLTGDALICQTGSIIQNYFGDKALCGRVGGDEFLVYIGEASDIPSILLQAEMLRQEICRQTSVQSITVTTQASIGIAFSSAYCYDYETLFGIADGALYRAKLEGRNKVVVAE